jgi:RNA polymerase sigma factor (sigma-70 family)
VATEAALERARGGDDRAFGELTDPYRSELQLHCYRILGSVQDAEDVLQETMLAAWRGLGQYEGRASLRTWLYRIATNRCLNALRATGRRPRTSPESPSFLTAEPTRRGEPLWLEPYPDVLLEGLPDVGAGPEARYEAKEAIALAFVTAMQRPACLRLLPSGRPGAGVPRARDDRADPRRRPDLGRHPLRRQQQHGAVRDAADARLSQLRSRVEAHLDDPPAQLAVVDAADPESGRLSSSWAVGAVGARLPDTEKVRGSNPLRPTRKAPACGSAAGALSCLHPAAGHRHEQAEAHQTPSS